MYFADVTNPFGTDAFAAPTATSVKPHKLPKTRKGVRVLRAPKPTSTILKNILLTW